MSPARGQPLFDLIPKSRSPGSSAPLPLDREHPPQAEPAERHTDRPRRSTTGRVTIPVTWLYGSAAGLIVVLLVAYGIGYRVGAGAERAAVQGLVSQDAQRMLIEDPLADQPAARDTRAGETPPRPAQTSTTAPSTRTGQILTPLGPSETDPRLSGHNYLELATLPREQAEEAVRYLASRGVESIAVPASGLDRGRAGRNTSDRFRVIVVEMAVPGDRFSSSASQRAALERRMAQLGKAWAEQGGASDFASPLWRRHGG